MADIAKKEYRNVFAELGIHQAEVETRLQEIIRFYFYGEEQERVYYPVGKIWHILWTQVIWMSEQWACLME